MVDLPELQIGGGIKDNSEIFFLFFTKNICCDPSLEPLNETVLMMGHKICFYGEIYTTIPKLSLLSRLIWSTGINTVSVICR